MIVEVKVPQLSESVSEATLLEWHKKEGEPVSRDENLIDIETDKVVMELPAPADGVLTKIMKQTGGAVSAGEVIATIDTDARASAAPACSAISSSPGAPSPRRAGRVCHDCAPAHHDSWRRLGGPHAGHRTAATRRASGMKSARVVFGCRPNSLSTSAKPEIDVMWSSKV